MQFFSAIHDYFHSMDKDGWNTFITAISTLIGAIVGAIVGGLISWLIQRQTIQEARAERLEAKRQEDIAVGIRMVVKLIAILSNFNQIKDSLDRAVNNSPPNFPAWLRMQPFATIPPRIEFSNDEMAFIFSIKISNAMLEVVELANVYNDTLQLIEKYGKDRLALTSQMPVTAVSGNTVVTDFDEPTLNRLLPIIYPVNILAEELLERRSRNYDDARRLFHVMQSHCAGRFGPNFPPFRVVEP